jgi:hypothetical protein
LTPTPLNSTLRLTTLPTNTSAHQTAIMAGLVNKVKDLLHGDKDTTHSKYPQLRVDQLHPY